MTSPNPPFSGPWTLDRIEQYRNMALLEQPPVIDGVRDISQDPDLFSIMMEADPISRMATQAPYTNTALAMLVANRAFLGTGENPANVNAITLRYNKLYHIGTNSFAWCDATQTLAAVDSNNEKPVLGGHGKAFAYVPAHAAWFQSIGRLHWGLATKPGQIQFFRWSGAKQTTMCDHVGICESNNGDGTRTFIEGNSADKDRRVVRDGKYAACYGDPAYLPPNPNAFPGRILQLKAPMMHGSDVKWVQSHLNQHHGSHLTIDGIYGRDTRGQVVGFQKARKLIVDGNVGPVTWSALV